jgi:hypothetical protein
MNLEVPTPTQPRELAVRAESLAAAVDDVKARMQDAPDRPTSRVAFRLDVAAGQIRGSAVALRETAADLERVLARSDCAAEWGACPEHGGRLRGSGGVTWCEGPGCRRAWNYNRLGLPCSEPAVYVVRDGKGSEMRLCAGHTVEARAHLSGDRLYIPLTGARS